MLMDTLIFYYDVIITSFSDKKEKDLFRVNGYPFMVIAFVTSPLRHYLTMKEKYLLRVNGFFLGLSPQRPVKNISTFSEWGECKG